MSKKRRNKEQSVPIKKESLARFVADFSFQTTWVSINHSGFTNMLKDSDQFFKLHNLIFNDILPTLKQVDFVSPGEYILTLKRTSLPHSHSIEDDEKIKLINDILVKALMKVKNFSDKDASKYLKQNLDGEKLYQIGKNSVRFIGYFEKNVFIILLIDYHHLLYPSNKHNENDHSSYSICPFEKGR